MKTFEFPGVKGRGVIVRWLIVSSLLWFVPVDRATGETARVFKNEDGLSIEAVLLEVEGETALIKRASDGKEFRLPIGKLSAEDQVWVRDWAERRPKPLPGDWSRLRVELSSTSGELEVVGMDKEVAIAPLGGGIYDLMIPRGAWLLVKDVVDDGRGRYAEHLLRFDGEQRWKLSFFGDVLLLARDDGPPRVAGIIVPSDENERDLLIGRLKNEPTEELLSVQVYNGLKASDLSGLKAPIGGVVMAYGVEEDTFGELARLKPKAIGGSVPEEFMNGFGEFEGLEALSLRFSTSRSSAGEGGGSPSSAELSLVRSPELRDFTLTGIPLTDGLGEMLVRLEKLRCLEFVARSTDGELPNWNFGDAGHLEALSLSRQKFMPSEVVKLSGLKSLCVNFRTVDEKDPALSELAGMKGLLQLAIKDSLFPDKVWEQWVEGGGLDELRVLRLPTIAPESLSALTSLEVLEVPKERSTGGGSVNFSELGKMKSLKSLSFRHGLHSNIEALAGLPNRDGLEVLDISYGSYDDLAGLEALSSLSLLGLRGNRGQIPEIDLGQLPNLIEFEASGMNSLVSISGVATHPSLVKLRLIGCDELESLGEKAPNTVLRELYLYDCARLKDLTGLHETSGLKALRISKCNSLQEPLVIDEVNQIASLRVTDCDHLEKR